MALQSLVGDGQISFGRRLRAGVEVARENDDGLTAKGVTQGDGAGQPVEAAQELGDLLRAISLAQSVLRSLRAQFKIINISDQ